MGFKKSGPGDEHDLLNFEIPLSLRKRDFEIKYLRKLHVL